MFKVCNYMIRLNWYSDYVLMLHNLGSVSLEEEILAAVEKVLEKFSG